MNTLFLYSIGIITTLLGTPIYCDSATPWQINFQDSASPIMEGIVNLHHDIFFFLILIFTIVFWLFSRILQHFNSNNNQ